MRVPICTVGKITAIAILFLVGAAGGLDTQPATGAERTAAESDASSGRPAGELPEDEDDSASFFPVEAIHEMIREERRKTLLEVDKDLEVVLKHVSQERLTVLREIANLHKATLDYVTDERKAVMAQLIAELTRITDLLAAERRTTMLELEVAGNRIVEGALQRSERLVDHVFIRLAQLLLAAAVGLGILAWIAFRVIESRKSKMS